MTANEARIDAPPVNEHGAGAALALIAAFFRPGQVQMLAQQVKERRAGIEHEGMTRPVDGQAHRNRLRRRQAGGRLSPRTGGTEIRVCSVIGHPQLLSSMSYYVPFFLTIAIQSSPGLGELFNPRIMQRLTTFDELRAHVSAIVS
jgi:hypothetical protein